MKKTWFQARKGFKGKVALQELRRAHIIIALLSFSLAFLVIISSLYPIQLDTFLSSIASALLIIIAAISISTVLAIPAKK